MRQVRPLGFTALPNAERLVRTLFWTFWVLTVALAAYGLAMEFFGLGLFLDSQVPKLHMRGEARLARMLSTGTALSSAIVCGFTRSLEPAAAASRVRWPGLLVLLRRVPAILAPCFESWWREAAGRASIVPA